MPYTSLRVLAPPSSEPVTVALLKRHLRVDTDDQDDLISAYAVAARDRIERHLNRALVTQTLQWFLKRHPDEARPVVGWRGGPYWHFAHHRAIELPRPPVQSIVSLSILDAVGNTTATAFPNAPAIAGATTLQFPAVGFPGFVGNGIFIADLTAAAIPLGATVSGTPSITSPNVTVTLSAPLSGNLGQDDAVVFASKAPLLPLPVQPNPSPAPSLYLADLDFDPARLRIDWPILNDLGTLTRPIQHIEVDFVAGYGAATAVPQPIVQAIMLLTAFLYERRGDDGGETPKAVDYLIAPYRVMYFGG